MAKNFKDLSEQEILALAISSEETDAHLCRFRRGIVVGTFARDLLPAHRALSTHSKERPQNLADAQ